MTRLILTALIKNSNKYIKKTMLNLTIADVLDEDKKPFIIPDHVRFEIETSSTLIVNRLESDIVFYTTDTLDALDTLDDVVDVKTLHKMKKTNYSNCDVFVYCFAKGFNKFKYKIIDDVCYALWVDF